MEDDRGRDLELSESAASLARDGVVLPAEWLPARRRQRARLPTEKNRERAQACMCQRLWLLTEFLKNYMVTWQKIKSNDKLLAHSTYSKIRNLNLVSTKQAADM